MRKDSLLAVLSLLTATIANGQFDSWQPSRVYAIDKTVVSQIRNSKSSFKNNLSDKDFDLLKEKLLAAISQNTPGFVKLDSLLAETGINFTGISSSKLGSGVESVIATMQGYSYRQYLQKEYVKEDARLQDFKVKMIESVNNTVLPVETKKEISQRIKSLPVGQLFEFGKEQVKAIDNLGTEISGYLTNKLGNEWDGIKQRLSADAEKILEIPNRLKDEVSGYLDKNFQVLNDISYFAAQINNTKVAYEKIKDSDPAGAFKLLQTNELYQKIIESSNLRQFNDYGVKALSVIQDADQLREILSGNGNPLNKALQSFTIIEKQVRTFFPPGSADLNKSLEALSHSEDLAKVNLYATLGSFAINSGIIPMSEEQKTQANLLLNAGMAAFSFYSGNILGGITGTIGVLNGLFGGGNKQQDNGMIKMMMDFQYKMVKHIDEQLKNLNDNLVIISNQINHVSQQITQLRGDILEFRKEAASYYQDLSKQIESVYKVQVEILKDVYNLHKDMFSLFEDNSIKMNVMNNKLDLVYQQNGCIILDIQTGFLQQLLGCRGTLKGISKSAPKTINDYDDLYSTDIRDCYKAIRSLIKPDDLTTPFIDYTYCTDNLKPDDPGHDPILFFGELRRRWVANNSSPENFLALVNPSTNLTEDPLIQRSIENNSGALAVLYPASKPENYRKTAEVFSRDKLNNPQFVIELTNWYLQAFPFAAIINNVTDGKKDRSQIGKLSTNEISTIAEDMEFLKNVLQITIAQQSLMSGTTLLNELYNTLKFGNLSERQAIVDLLEKNLLLKINFTKFACALQNPGIEGGFMIKNNYTVMGRLSQKYGGPGNFYIIVAKSDTENFSGLIDQDQKQGSWKMSTLLEKGTYSLINDKKILKTLDDPNQSTERVLPQNFYSLLDLHKKLITMITEIRSLQTFSPDDLKNLKSVYLN